MNTNPTITADALCEYLVSSPTRRMALLERAKYPAMAPPAHWGMEARSMRALAIEAMLGRRDPFAEQPVPDLIAAFFTRDWERVRGGRLVDVVPELAAAPMDVGGVTITGCGPDVVLSHHHGAWTRFDGLAGSARSCVARLRAA